MIKYYLKNNLFSYLASILLISIEKRIIAGEEELVEWEPVEKMNIGEKLFCNTCPYEDVLESINNDIKEIKNTVSIVYAMQDKKHDKKKNKVKEIPVNIQEDEKEIIPVDIQEEVKKDIKVDKVAVKKEVKEKPVKPKKKVNNNQRKKSTTKHKKRRKSKNLTLNTKILKSIYKKTRKKILNVFNIVLR
ncbi:MAG: hypothetical protein MUO82_10955 [Candidatus Thermoplasmatota archaeon]|nr:hypothetical protein [Candidatus Thermoplasmatota archaeon]